MFFESFHERFPEIAVKETRTITVANHPKLPDDEFGLLEAFCSDRNCDCRRVMFTVISRRRGENVAIVAYGWESEDFYANWLGDDNPDMVKDLQGPILNPGSPQSEIAPALLAVVGQVLKDEKYVDRLKRHYRLFKSTVDKKPKSKKRKRGRRKGR
ncbi:MAG: hypothetical protein P8X95_06285 [Anaerolineales bacterium]|jgi:hypothetical protein